MNSRYLPLYPVLLLLSFHSIAQQAAFNQNSSRSNHTRAFNQNSSRSNHTRSMNAGNDWQFGISSGASLGLSSNEASLFRGNGFTTGLTGQYFAGPLGLGISAGFINSKLNTSAINQFIVERRFPQTGTISTTPAQNAFLMLGPSFRLGTKVQLLAGVKAGIFFNQGGGLIIGQQGALRPFYRFESSTKSLFPGFNGSVSFSYPVGHTSAIVLSTDYLRSSSSVQLFDPQRGIDIPVEQKRNFQTINAGVSFIKTFNVKSPRDAASGQASGKRSAVVNDDEQQTTNRVIKTKTRSNQSNDRVSNDSDDEGVSIIDPENKRVLKTKTKSNQSNDRTNQNCGPVTLKTTRPDGMVEEQTFSCPDDALQYQQKSGGMPNRISMNVTTPKQTQGATFGEKVNRGLQSAGSHIVAGRIIRTTNEKNIVTNRNHIGGAAAASYAATGLMVQPGIQTHLYVRESGSGMATGKRTREAGSGMATGRRQYQPLFFDGLPQEDVCNPCLGQVKNNPLYEEKGGANNPLYKGRTIGKEQCDDKNPVFDVQLIDRNTGAVVATTKTNACGEYWFANVPDGNYSVAVLAIWTSKKGYDYYKATSDVRIDIAGEVVVPDETWQHIIYGAARGKVSVQDISVVVADTDGDGMAEFFRASGTLTDGTVQDFTQPSAAKGGGTGKVSMQDFHFTLPVSNQRSGGSGKVSVQDIHFTKRAGANTYTAVATFSDGTTQHVTDLIDMKQSGAVLQCSVQLGDVDGDGMADLIWSPRSNFGTSSQSAKVNVQDLSFTKKPDYYVQYMPVQIGDVDGDGAEDLVIGNGNGKVSDFGMSRKSTGFQNGDIPDQNDFTAAKPGNPIRGLTVKGGRNPGWDTIPAKRTNNLGEFEFPNLEAGNYWFTTEATYIVHDVTELDLFDTLPGNINTSESNLEDRIQKEGGATTKARDYNSSRSNKTASIASFNDLLEVLNELDQQLQKDNTPSTKAGVSTSRSNIRNLTATIESIINDIENDNTSAAKQKMNSMNMQLLALQQSLQKLGSRYTAVSNVLKTKHDTAKNSISNIR